jgi:hypothetical protein
MQTATDSSGAELPRARHRPRLVWLTIAVVVVAAVVLVPVGAPQVGYGVIRHVVCAKGPVLATEDFWTPLALLNSPYRGEGWANLSYRSALMSINATGGRAVGLFVLDEWNLTRLVNSSALGPGVSHPCTQGAQASPSEGNSLLVDTIPNPSNESDVAEADQVVAGDFILGSPLYGQNVTSVLFQNDYVDDDAGGLGTCNASSPTLEPAYSTSYPVVVPFDRNPSSGAPEYGFPAPVPIAVTYSYEFPAGGNYYFFDPSKASPPYGGGLAFDYMGCQVNPHPPGTP